MTVVNEVNWRCFLACIEDLLRTDEVQSMRGIHHHPGVSCYEHSVFVAYVAFRLARRWHLDYVSAARGGLLHDLYLYDPHDKTAHAGNQCFDHPKAALRNAGLLTALTPKEQNMILAHMWPLARRMPHCREAYVVNLADKLCATAEVFGYWRRSHMKQIVMA